MTATHTAPKPLARTDTPTDRVALAAGYRHLADLIESGQAPLPVNASIGLHIEYADWRTSKEDQPARARDLMRALGGGRYEKDEFGGSLILRGMCAGLPVDVWIDRDAVCERVVTGTKTVTEIVPVGEDTRPVEAVIREVETFEWRCAPLLAAASEDANTIQVTA